MKKTKNVLFGALIALTITSCSVQQFPVSTSVQPFQNGGRLFGEKMKGKTYKRDGELFLLGINVINCDTKRMADDIKATSYTIETKYNILSWAVNYFTYGAIQYKVVKVIKREN